MNRFTSNGGLDQSQGHFDAGNDDSCIEYPKETSSSRGNGSDLILEGEADDSSSDDEENAV